MTSLCRTDVSLLDVALILVITTLALFSGGIVGAVLGVLFATFLVTTIDRLDALDERIVSLAEENERLREDIDRLKNDRE